MKNEAYIPCPYCGEEIKATAKACPHCGSDESTGWGDNTYLDGIDVGDSFDYEDMVAQEFPGTKKKGTSFFRWKTIVGGVMLALFLLMLLRLL